MQGYLRTTYASLAEGRLIVRDRKSQQQDLSDLRRDARSTHQPLKTIFDQDKVQKRIDKGKLIWDAGQQITDIALTEASLNAANSVDRRHPDLKGEAREAAIQAEINQSGWGIGGDNRRLAEAGALLIQGLASGDISQAAARASAPYIAHAIGQNVTDDKAKLAAHGIASVALALATGEDPAARTLGAITAEATGMLSEKLYGKPAAKLSESEKATVSAFASLAAGIAASLTGEGIESAARAAEAGKTVVENNHLSLPNGLQNYGQAIASWDQYAEANGLTPEQKQAGLDKLAKGELPEGASIAKVIVDGYKDGVLIAGAAYLGPAATVGKAVGGAVIGGIANGTYQWFDLSQPGNENKSWDYKSSVSAGITGALAPGRGVWQNVGVASGGALFSDGPDVAAIGSSAAGAWAGGMFGEYAPGMVNSVIGKEAPGFIFDVVGSLGSEFLGGYTKELLNTSNNQDTSGKEAGGKK